MSKRVFLQNLSYENDIDLRENKVVEEAHFHMNGFDIEAKGNLEMACWDTINKR